jgi:hypothetical protein
MSRVIVSPNPATLIEVDGTNLYYDGIPVAVLTALGRDWVLHNQSAWNDAERERSRQIAAMLEEKYGEK